MFSKVRLAIVVPLPPSLLASASQLSTLFDGRRAAFLDIVGEISQMHPALGLLAAFDAHDGRRNITAKRLGSSFSTVRWPKKSLQTCSTGTPVRPS